jgi:hypothetical protein
LSTNNFQKGELKGDFGFIFLPGKATALSGNLQPEKLLDNWLSQFRLMDR